MSDIYHQRNYVELLLRHLLLSPAVLKKAQTLGLTSDDFLPPGEYQIPTYKVMADLALEINSSPVDPALLEVLVSHRTTEGSIPEHVAGELARLINDLRSDVPVMDAFFLEDIQKFIRARRGAKIIAESGGNLDHIHEQFQKVIFPLDTMLDDEAPIEDRFVSPFDKILKKSQHAMVSTGFEKLNAALGGGVGYREFGLIVGHSGGGKTAMGTSIARGAALAGHKVIYCSMEENKEDIANRMYSAVFKVDYTSLHNGSGYLELEQKVSAGDDAERMQILKDNLIILDLKGLTPVKPSQLKQLLDDYCAKTGFIFQLLVVDQLQFLEPEHVEPGEQDWVKEGRIVKEMDEMSHKPIGETNNYYAMWLLHQAKGKVKLYFTTDEIAGFKGIVHKPETVLGIGRENPSSNDFELFSMKNRHAKNFRLPLHGDLSYMTFIEKAEGVGESASVASVKPTSVKTMMSSNHEAPEMAQLLSKSVIATGPPQLSPLAATLQ